MCRFQGGVEVLPPRSQHHHPRPYGRRGRRSRAPTEGEEAASHQKAAILRRRRYSHGLPDAGSELALSPVVHWPVVHLGGRHGSREDVRVQAHILSAVLGDLTSHALDFSSVQIAALVGVLKSKHGSSLPGWGRTESSRLTDLHALSQFTPASSSSPTRPSAVSVSTSQSTSSSCI